MTQLTLSSGTQAAINTAVANGPGTNNINYYTAYNDIYNDLVAQGGINAGTLAWFAQAGNVNRQQYQSSAAGTYIWNFTTAAVQSEGGSVTTAQMQAASNAIASQVFADLQRSNYVFSDSTSSQINFAPSSIISIDAGAGFGAIQADNTGISLDYAAWGGSLFARTELQDPTFFADNHLGVSPGTKDCDAMVAGFYSAAIAEFNGGYGASAVLNALNGNLDTQALGICLGPVTTATLNSPTVTVTNNGTNNYTVGFNGTYSDGSTLASSAAYNGSNNTWTTTATDTTSAGYEFNQDVLTETTSGLTSDDKGLNTSGGVTYEQVTTTPTNGTTSATISGIGDLTDLSTAAISLAASAQAELDGMSNAITMAANALLTLGNSSASNTTSVASGGTLTDKGSNNIDDIVGGVIANIFGGLAGADSVNASGGGTVNIEAGAVGNVSGSGGTQVTVGAGANADIIGSGTTTTASGAGAFIIDQGASDLLNLTTTGITAYMQGAGSVVQDTGGSNATWLQGQNTVAYLMGGNDNAHAQTSNEGIVLESVNSSGLLLNTDNNSWAKGTITVGGETITVQETVGNGNNAVNYSDTSSGTYNFTNSISLSNVANVDFFNNTNSYFGSITNFNPGNSQAELFNYNSSLGVAKEDYDYSAGNLTGTNLDNLIDWVYGGSQLELLSGLATNVANIFKNYTGVDDSGSMYKEVIDANSGTTIGDTHASSIDISYFGAAFSEKFFSGSTQLGFVVGLDDGTYAAGGGLYNYLQDTGYAADFGSGNGSDSGIPNENDSGSFSIAGFDGGDEFTSASAVTSNVTNLAQYVVANGDANATQAAENSAIMAYGAATYSSDGATNAASYVVEGAKWASKTITWSFANSAGTAASPFSSYITNSTYQTLVRNAFAAWAAACPGLTFTQVTDSASSDIRLGFGRFSTATSGVAGYTAYQQNSSLQIQPNVILRLEDPSQLALTGSGSSLKYSGTNTYLYEDILHEIGHALGLASDADSSSIMYYYANGNTGTLDSSDTAGIQALYGTGGHAQVMGGGTSTPSADVIHQQMVQANAAFLGESSATLAATSTLPPSAIPTNLALPALH